MAQNQKTVTSPIKMDSRKFLGAEEETKRCLDCDNDLFTSSFGSNRTRWRSYIALLLGLQIICKLERNKKSERTRTQLTWLVRKRLKKEDVCNWLRLNGVELRCSECPQDYPATLDFHHDDPIQKSFSISPSLSAEVMAFSGYWRR